MAAALITGPTAGIGRAFAQALAERGMDLVLVSRDAQRLQQVADEIRATCAVGIASIEVLPADLANRQDVDRVADRLRDPARPIQVLVNNAGFGLAQGFVETTIDQEQQLLDVLVTAVLRLTHAAVPGMVARGRGVIFNVSSVAGWITGSTYSAAKSWVTVFTEGLAQDLADTGVRAVAVCPGYVRTEFHDRAAMDVGEVPEWMWLDADDVAAQAMRDAEQGRVISVTGPQYKAMATLLQHAPRPLVRLASRARGPRGPREPNQR
jgi:short-subunit dehydrogenase